MRRERVRILKTFLGCLGLPVHDPVRVLPLSHLRHTLSPAPLWGEQDKESLKGLPEKELKKEALKIPRGAEASGLGGIHSDSSSCDQQN